MNPTLTTLSDKLHTLETEVKNQTTKLSNIETHTGVLAQVAVNDQEARDRIYDNLAKGLLRLANCIGVAVVAILILSVVGSFRQEITAKFGDYLEMSTQAKQQGNQVR